MPGCALDNSTLVLPFGFIFLIQLAMVYERGFSKFRRNQKPTRGSTASALGLTKGAEPARMKWVKLHRQYLPLVAL